MSFFSILVGIVNHPNNKNKKILTLVKLVWWKINQLLFQLPVVVQINKAIFCICYPTSSYSNLIVYNRLPEYPEMILLQRYLSSNDIFLDIGANVGLYSLLAAERKAKVYSLEPHPKALKVLYQNIKLNSFEKLIKVYEKVASDKTGTEKFFFEDITEYSHMSHKNSQGGKPISSVKLDSFCQREKINYIDAIKIDTEGAELKILKGLQNFLKNKRIGLLIAEVSRNTYSFGNSPKEIIEYLNSWGYLTFKLTIQLKLLTIKPENTKEAFNVIAFLQKDRPVITKLLKSVIKNNLSIS